MAAEVVVGVLVLFMVGLLTSLPTARETIAAESGRTVFHIDENNVHVSLYVSPGAVGTNLYTADFGLAPEELPDGTHVILRTTPEDDLEGVREAHLLEVEPGRYEATGSELSVVGDWNLELILRRPGEADWRTTVETTIQSAPPEERAPGPAPRFTGTDGAIWMVVLGTAVVVVVVGLRRVNGRGLAAFGAVLLVVSVVGLGVNREYPRAEAENPVEVTEATIAHAEILFAENCAVCHGPAGEGDGEFLAGRDAPNADLTAPHLYDHTEAEIYARISQGVSGTPMPGFEHELTSDEIWHLVNYVYYLNEEASAR